MAKPTDIDALRKAAGDAYEAYAQAMAKVDEAEAQTADEPVAEPVAEAAVEAAPAATEAAPAAE